MLTFEVKDMTCGHCVATITKAVQAADRNASVDIDLGRHLVRVDSAGADAPTLRAAIAEAGYTPVQVATAATAPSAIDAPARKGGCCGC